MLKITVCPKCGNKYLIKNEVENFNKNINSDPFLYGFINAFGKENIKLGIYKLACKKCKWISSEILNINVECDIKTLSNNIKGFL